MENSEPVIVVGSLQNHAAISHLNRGGVCPCIGTTDFGLPKVFEVYRGGPDMEKPAERDGV